MYPAARLSTMKPVYVTAYDVVAQEWSSNMVKNHFMEDDGIQAYIEIGGTHLQWAKQKGMMYLLTNKWQVYLRSIWNKSEQCLYLVTQRSQFFRYFHTKMSRLQWKPFLVYEMHCWSLCILSFGRGEAFSVADTDNIDGTNQQQLIQFSSRIWCPQIVQFNWHHWMRRAIREKIHNLN